jgi:two-component system, cell cycle sensor histidine kinase and response regulator CckA
VTGAGEKQNLGWFLEAIIENVPAMIFVKDAEHLRFERFNRAGEELLGMRREDLLGKNDYDFFPPEQAAFFQAKDREVLERGELLDIPEEPIDTPRGKRWLHTRKIPIRDDNGVPKYLLGISIDITEQKRAKDVLQRSHEELEALVRERTVQLKKSEEQLRQAVKMEAIGRLAGGIAHDFNNLLSVILSCADLAQDAVDTRSPAAQELLEIERAGKRASELTRQLLAFSRQQVLEPRVVDLNELIGNLDKMLRRVLGDDIDLVSVQAPHLGRVRVDPGQIEQVIMNLAVNARDAMPKGGKLTIETANIDLDDIYVAGHLGVTPGPHVMLAVTDTGLGMDRETQARIFEPFFTTKDVGKGTGLGLSTVFGIVKQSNGSIFVYSELGKGTTFKVYLPRTDARREEVGADLPRGGSGLETILIVEDHEQVRSVVSVILKGEGYRVLEAGGGDEALRIATEHSGKIDLLVTDVVMPKMSGRTLAERLNTTRPEMKVLYTSGYTDDTVVRHGVLEGDMAFLQKPITPRTLTRKVREVLDG